MVRDAFALIPGTCIKLLWYIEDWVTSSDIYSPYCPNSAASLFSIWGRRGCIEMDMAEDKCGCRAPRQVHWCELLWNGQVFLMLYWCCELSDTQEKIGWSEHSSLTRDQYFWTSFVIIDIYMWKDKLWLIELVFDRWELIFVVSGIWNPLTWANFTAWRLNLSCKAEGGMQTFSKGVCWEDMSESAQIYESVNCF